jgi:hypothetical protein
MKNVPMHLLLILMLHSNIPRLFRCHCHGQGGGGGRIGTCHPIIADPRRPFCLAILAVDHRRRPSTSLNVVVVFHFAIVQRPAAAIVGVQSWWYPVNLPVQHHHGGWGGSHYPLLCRSCHVVVAGSLHCPRGESSSSTRASSTS